MEKKETKMQIPKITLDSLFTTQEQRDEAKLEKVIEIKINEIDDFPNHPFKVIDNEEMEQMKESVIENGVLIPALVRQKADGRYEMISGHRRKFASQLANKDTIPCIVRDLSDDEATIIMVDSNMQREEILPSERAFAYKMKIEAMSNQGKRTDLETSSQVGKKLNAYEELADETGESRNQIHRFIRLTNLIPELLEKVDNKDIAFNPAVELSYLTEEEQYALLDCIEYNDCTPSHAQSIVLKKLSQAGELNEDKIDDILAQEKPNQIPKMKFSEERIRSVLPKNVENDKIEDFVVKAIEYYSRHLKQREMSAR
ncbi:MAG: ParB/RepB/Spo0J family partition protein [Christensenellales bacterium]